MIYRTHHSIAVGHLTRTYVSYNFAANHSQARQIGRMQLEGLLVQYLEDMEYLAGFTVPVPGVKSPRKPVRIRSKNEA